MTDQRPAELATAQQIDVLRRQLGAVERTNAQLVGAIVNLTVGVIITDPHLPDNPIIFTNPSFTTMTGYTAAEVLGQNCRFLQGPETERAAVARIWTAICDQRPITEVLLNYRKDGTAFWNELTITPIRDADDQVVNFVGLQTDVTMRKRDEALQRLLSEASARLAESLDYKTTLETVAGLAVPAFADWCFVEMLDADGVVRPLAVEYRDPVKVAMAYRILERFPIDLAAPYGTGKVIRTGEPELITETSDDMLMAIAQDDEHLAELRAVGFRSHMSLPLTVRGRTFGVLSLVYSESQRHYTTDDLEPGRELARRAALAIENAELYTAAQEAIQIRDAFLGVASHELKTPVTSLQGYAQLLIRRASREHSLPERDMRALQTIDDQSQRLSGLINKLLDVSRIQLGQFNSQHQPVDLTTLAQKIVEETQLTLQEHTVTLASQAEPLMVNGDEGQLEQVLQNLLQNAIKYSPRGGLVTVTLQQHEANIYLVVKDQGIGIPKAGQAQLFQRFYRASNVTAHQISGLGIGLYLVHEIVTRHGGTVQVESAEGEGSTFIVCLPLLN